MSMRIPGSPRLATTTFNAITGTNGNDSLVGTDAADSITGLAGNDTLLGGLGDDWLLGGSGSDFFGGGAGNDTLDGGTITDRINYTDLNAVSYVTATGGTVINLQTGQASDGLGGTDTLINIDWVTGSNYADSITGSSTSDLFEQFEGLGGNDTIDGGAIDANNTNGNRAEYGASPAAIYVDLGAGFAKDGFGGTDTLIHITQVRGSNYGDTLIGSNTTAYTEGFQGRAGNDTINGMGGSDQVRYDSATSGVTVNLGTGTASDGQGGTDTLISIEAVRGSAYGDTLTGSDSTLVVESFDGRSGNDTINGMGGEDRVDYRNDQGAVSVSLGNGIGLDSWGGTDTLINIERVRGSTFNDTLSGSTGNNYLAGDAGADFLSGGGGNDTLDGGTITDHINYTDLNTANYSGALGALNINLSTGVGLDGSGGTDTLIDINSVIGSGYGDKLTGSATTNLFEQFEGGAGNDTLDGGAIDALGTNNNRASYANSASAVTVNLTTGVAQDGTGGTDTLLHINMVRGSASGDTLTGSDTSAYTEFFEGRAGNDTLNGLGGYDQARYDNAFSAVNVNLATGVASDGQGGTDTLLNIEGIRGSAYDDVLTGGNPANGAAATDGFEFFEGRAGNDTIDGGVGYDRADYSSSNIGVVATLGGSNAGTAQDGWGGIDTLINIEALRGSNYGDVLTGSDTAGFESFEGRAGNDTLNGLGGTDRADYKNDWAAVNINLTTGVGLDGFGGTDTLLNIENVRGSGFNDSLTGSAGINKLEGNEGNDSLSGAAGNDVLDGGVGNDTLNGGSGADSLTGGDGNDTYYVDNASDQVIETNATTSTGGTDLVLSSISNYTLGNCVENGRINTVNAANLTGNSLNNVLYAGAGNNILNGSTGTDTVSYTYATVGITVNLASTVAQATVGSGSDTLTAIESLTGSAYADKLTGSTGNNKLDGGNGNDSLSGGNGNDTLLGGAGNDTLIGGAGKDSLTGGAGNDVFHFASIGDAGVGTTSDVISDFTAGQDRIDLSGIDANTSASGNNAFSAPVVDGTFSGSFANVGDLYFDSINHILYGNNDADAQADFAITLTGVTSLTASDLLL